MMRPLTATMTFCADTASAPSDPMSMQYGVPSNQSVDLNVPVAGAVPDEDVAPAITAEAERRHLHPFTDQKLRVRAIASRRGTWAASRALPKLRQTELGGLAGHDRLLVMEA
jgi:hypothetical protein